VTWDGGGTLNYIGTTANTLSGTTRARNILLKLDKPAGVNAIAGPLVLEQTSGGPAYPVELQAADQILDSASVTVNTGHSLFALGFNETLNDLNLNGGGVNLVAGTLTLGGNVDASGGGSIHNPISLGGVTRTFSVTSGTMHIYKPISNGGVAAGITKTGAGTLTLDGTNTFTGAVTLNAGTLQANSDSAFGSTAGGVTVSGGTLTLNNVDIGAEALSLSSSLTTIGTNSWAGAVTLPTEILLPIPASSQLTFSGAVGGAGSITKSGEGTMVFSGSQANTFSGGIAVSGGVVSLNKTGVNAIVGPISIGAFGPDSRILRLQQPNQIADTVAISMTSNGTFDLNNNSETIGSLEGAGAVNLVFATLTTGGNNNTTTFSGSIGGVGGAPFIKNGSGTFTLTGTNNVLGTASVNNGKLIVDGELTCHVSLAAGTTLGGSGKVANLTSTSAHIQPGNSPGKLSTGNLQLNNSGGSATFEIFGVIPGSVHDQIVVTGTVTLNNPTLALTVGTAGGLGNKYVLIDNNGVDAVIGTFNGLAEGATINAGLVSYTISYVGGTGNDVVLTQIGAPPGPQITGVAKNIGGGIDLTATGLANTAYVVEATTNLNPAAWQMLNTVSANGSGVISFTDSQAPNHPMRFYRLKLP
jgi:autotransporter-associated beta strand protein